jgi:hypothetical protein
MSEWAMLKDKKVVRGEMMECAKWLESHPETKRVAATLIPFEGGEIRVSTVFLGLNHSWDQRPLWFETMVFEGPNDGDMERYETFEQAEFGHDEMVRRVHELLGSREGTDTK